MRISLNYSMVILIDTLCEYIAESIHELMGEFTRIKYVGEKTTEGFSKDQIFQIIRIKFGDLLAH